VAWKVLLALCKKLHTIEKNSSGAQAMSAIRKSGVRTRIIATVYTVLRLIPTVPMIGVSGSFSLSDILAPLYGVLLGSYVGGFSVILGSFLAIGLGRPVTFMFLDFLPATINAVALGLLIKHKWMPVVVLYTVLLVAFLLHPLSIFLVQVGSFSFPFAWMHIVAFIVLLSPLGRKAAQWIETLTTINIAKGLVIMIFIGTMMQHLMGNLLFEVVLGQILESIPAGAYPGYWTAIFFVYPWERLALIAFGVLIGTPLVRVLKKSFFPSEKQQLKPQQVQ
jgi:hypothetical protein